VFALRMIFLIGFISFVSSTYPGETISVTNTLGTENLNHSIIDNSTAIEGLVFNITSSEIRITLPLNMPPANFSILFISEGGGEVVVPVTSGGGGGGGSRIIHLCGNGVCDSIETSDTCPADCPVNLRPLSTPNNNPNGEGNEITTPTESTTTSTGLFGITGGSITNFVKSGVGIATFVILIAIIIAILSFLGIRKRKVKGN
jgi:hypothetical protein